MVGAVVHPAVAVGRVRVDLVDHADRGDHVDPGRLADHFGAGRSGVEHPVADGRSVVVN